MAKMTAREKMIKNMERVIAKHMWTAVFDADEDVANNASHELTRKNKNPDNWDEFVEAYANVEARVKLALGVKK